MHFTAEERSAWVRTGTHTVVLDNDPDFARFAHDEEGRIVRLLRVWVVLGEDEKRAGRAYLGSCRFCRGSGAVQTDLLRMLRNAALAADRLGRPRAALRQGLTAFLRARLA